MTPDYKNNAPAGYMGDARRGAALGRPTLAPASPAASPKISLRRVYLNSGGYDVHGAYYGTGTPLYWAADDSGDYDVTFRAADRATAKAIVRKTFPGARFYN